MASALLVVDMINEFITGKFGSKRVQKVVEPVVSLRDTARREGIPVFYTSDSHRPSDPEMKVWGRHAMAGTTAADIVPELKPLKGEKIFRKRQYSGFLNTGLEEALKKEHVRSIYFAGVSTEICVQHNVADAFYRGYETIVVRECVESFDPGVKAKALKYMHTMYGSRIVDLDKVKF